MIRAILFDNDGTLSDSVPICRDATNKALVACGFSPVSLPEIVDGMRLDTVLRMMEHAGIDDRNLGRELADSYYAHAVPLADATPLFPGIADIIRSLAGSGYLLGAVSNNRSGVVRSVLETHRIAEYFSVVIGEDNADEPKPHPGGLLQACRLLDLSPESAVYVGDGPSDSLAASAAGIPSIGVLWNDYGGEDVSLMNFTATIRTPDELPDLLKTLSTAAIGS